jgi:hypothetical protein
MAVKNLNFSWFMNVLLNCCYAFCINICVKNTISVWDLLNCSTDSWWYQCNEWSQNDSLFNMCYTALCFGQQNNFYANFSAWSLFHIYFRLKCNLLSSHPTSSLHVLAVYGHHQVSSILLKLLHSMSKLCIACEHNIS